LELSGLDRALTVGAAVPIPAGDGAPRSCLGGQRIGRRGRFKAQIDITAGTCAEHVTITTDGIRLGKWPRWRTALRNLAFRLSMALVVYTTVLSSTG
jgi:hypothetical protein